MSNKQNPVSKSKIKEARMTAALDHKALTPEQIQIIENPGCRTAITKAQYQKLLNINDTIHSETFLMQSLLYVIPPLICCGLPHQTLKNEDGSNQTQYEKSYTTLINNVPTKVSITLGTATKKIPIPYGKDRLLLVFLQTQAKLTNSRTIKWEDAFHFLKFFDYDTGGKSYKWLAESWQRLANLYFTIQIENQKFKTRPHMLFEQLTIPNPKFIPENSTTPPPNPDSDFSITFTEQFYKELTNEDRPPVPLNLELMKAFKNNSTNWDLVSLFCYYSYNAQFRKNKTVLIPATELLDQLGTQATNVKEIRRHIRNTIEILKIAWPESKITLKRNGDLEVRQPKDNFHPAKSKDPSVLDSSFQPPLFQ
jgi:hypothetical protein